MNLIDALRFIGAHYHLTLESLLIGRGGVYTNLFKRWYRAAIFLRKEVSEQRFEFPSVLAGRQQSLFHTVGDGSQLPAVGFMICTICEQNYYRAEDYLLHFAELHRDDDSVEWPELRRQTESIFRNWITS
jgi:hypothetical protein